MWIKLKSVGGNQWGQRPLLNYGVSDTLDAEGGKEALNYRRKEGISLSWASPLGRGLVGA